MEVCYIHDGPQREIASQSDLHVFLNSDTFSKLFDFLSKLNDAAKDKTEYDAPSDQLVVIASLLNELKSLVSKFPPIQTNNRFGNPMFREWFDEACSIIRSKLGNLVPPDYWAEVSEYMTHALGSRQRIDYGTGHEAHFLAFLYCLDSFGIIQPKDYSACVLHVFRGYLEMTRLVQSTYWLEPAGSLGVWGLDDYHFLPFLFGSSQLYNHPHFRPKIIHDVEVREAFKESLMYFDAISLIVKVKGPLFHQHSPMLDDISAVKSWEKVNSGLLKMYRAEVFGKLPVMQHFLFGRILPFRGSKGSNELHEHQQGDCCGNPLPSAFPAVQDNIRGLSSLPFD